MNKNKYFFFLILGILFTAAGAAFFTACDNPIIAKWWPDEKPVSDRDIEKEPEVSGGSGDNFAVVIFDTDGGTPKPKALKITWENVIGRLRPISRGTDGFLGWFDEKGELWDVETRLVKKADDADGDGFITLIIKWVENGYTVKFVPYPSPVTPPISAAEIASQFPNQYVALHGKVVQPVTPVPYNTTHGFAGWYIEGGEDTRWNFNLGVSSDVTLYAKWDIDSHTIRFEANGGTRPDGVTKLTHEFTISLKYGLVQDPGPIVKEGHSFAGWYMEDPTFTGSPWNFAKKITDSDIPSVPVKDDVPQINPLTLYAKWERNIYNVDFVILPSTATAPVQQKVLHGFTVAKPVDPAQLGDGRGFAGWYTEDTFINQWNFENPITSTMTLYARFIPQTRTVHFQVNGGTTPGGMDFLPNRTISVPTGKIINPGTLNRERFTFGGWFTDPECKKQWNFDTPVTEPDNVAGEDPMYLYAKWTANPHTVTFNANSGTPAPLAQIVAHGERAVMPPIMTHPDTDMGFDGWRLGTANGAIYDFDTPVTSSFTLVAKWNQKQYTVVFHLGNPNGSPPSSAFSPAMAPPQHFVGDGKAREPFMPSLPESQIGNAWSFYGWYASDDPKNDDQIKIDTINDATDQAERDANLASAPWDFSKNISTGTNSSNVLNLYARWSEPAPDMVWVPRGSFVMGDSGVSGTPAAYHSYPTRRVTLDGFFIGRNEVTQLGRVDTNLSYTEVMGINPSQFYRNDVRPVDRVSWYDAVMYCNELTLRTPGMTAADQVYTITNVVKGSNLAGTGGVRPAAQSIISATVSASFSKRGYRLPTEAEWEYAARGGNNSPGNYAYSGSNDSTLVAWYNDTIKGADAGSTQTVGTKEPNALGIYDMSGNITEWVWDWFDSYKSSYYFIDYNSTKPVSPTGDGILNPTGPVSGTERVRRGGGWSNAVGNVRSVVRNSQAPGDATWVNGFRVVRGPGVIW